MQVGAIHAGPARASNLDCCTPLFIATQCRASLGPVSQYPALAIMSIHPVLLAIRPVSVAMDQARVVIFAQQGDNRSIVYVHERAILALLFHPAARTQLLDIGFTFCQWFGEELLLKISIMYLGAIVLI